MSVWDRLQGKGDCGGIFQAGDIIVFPRAVHYHFGIATGTDTVIHYYIHDQQELKNKAVVQESRLVDVDGYEHSYRDNFLDGVYSHFDVEDIMWMARDSIGEGNYSIVSNNCEHFVTKMRYDVSISAQISFATAGAAGLVDTTGLYALLRQNIVAGQQAVMTIGTAAREIPEETLFAAAAGVAAGLAVNEAVGITSGGVISSVISCAALQAAISLGLTVIVVGAVAGGAYAVYKLVQQGMEEKT